MIDPLQLVIGAISNALPFYPVYTFLMADLEAMPYLVVTSQGNKITYTTADPYIQEFTFLVSVFSTSLAGAESIAEQLDLAIQRQPAKFGTSCFECDKMNYTIAPVQTDYRIVAYGVGVTYTTGFNRSIENG